MTRKSKAQELIYFRLTGPGRGAVATISIHGQQVHRQLGQLFRPMSGQPLSQAAGQPFVYGNWKTEEKLGEDLVICPINDSSVEIHCHGGDAAVKTITDSLQSKGFRMASENEIAAIIEPNPWRLDFRQALSVAQTVRTAEILLNHYNLIQLRINKLARLIHERQDLAISQINQILAHTQFGIHLTKPWKVVLCGEPNVGKSSLINAIVGFQRTIVHPTAGTTRDVVSEATSINGWPIDLNDTAGLRQASNEIEEQGIMKARKEIQTANLVIYVTDALNVANEPDESVEELNPILVANKTDLVDQQVRSFSKPGFLPTSAVSGEGVAMLIDEIEQRLIPELPDDDQLIPINQLQVECYAKVAALIEQNEIESAWRTLRHFEK